MSRSVTLSHVPLPDYSMAWNSWNGQWSPRWQCAACTADNWSSAKKCWKCGIKKSYGGAPNSVRQIVQESPKDTAANATVQIGAGVMAQSEMEVGIPILPDNAPLEWSGWDRNTHQEAIKNLTCALNALGVCSPDITKDIQGKISLHKEAILGLKPIGAQIDGCRAALERAQARKEKATSAVDEAKQRVSDAETEVDGLTAKLASLEVQVAKSEDTEIPTAPNSIEKLANSLRQVMEEMSSSAHVDKELITQTQGHMSALLSGVRTISVQAQTMAASSSAESGGTKPAKGVSNDTQKESATNAPLKERERTPRRGGTKEGGLESVPQETTSRSDG